MEQNVKPFFKFVADKLASQLKAGTSSFQKPVKDNGNPAYVQPVNPTTGASYKSLNALALSLRGFDDPRFMTLDQANSSRYGVKPGAKGTSIEFNKTSDIQAVRTPDNKKIIGEDGKVVTKTVNYEQPVRTRAVLFNAEQLNKIQPLEEKLNFEPIERAETLLQESKAKIVHGGDEAFYDKVKDEIHLPDKASFETPDKYYQTAIHQLAHWTGHESRLNRPMQGKFGSMDYAKEEFRAAFAAQIIGSELKIGSNFGQHEAYSQNWVKMLKDDPFQIVLATKDAQKIADTILGIGRKEELKEEIETQHDVTVKTQAETKPEVDNKPDMTLKKDEVIPYKGGEYKVVEANKTSVKVENLLDGNRLTIKPSDKLYKNLVETRNNPDLQVAQTEEINNQVKRKI